MSSTLCPECPDLPLPADTVTAPRWAAVTTLALSVFGLVTAEFLPASLLTAIAADLGVSEGAAGQTVTATALVGAIAAPSIPVLTSRLDRKHVMLALIALLVFSNGLAASSRSLSVLLAARVMLGVALGGFWSMSAALAMRLVPEHHFARAMSIVLTGVSVATVCAAPIGAWMGEWWGWRSAFVAAGAVSVATLIAQWFSLPALPPKANPDLRVLGQLLTRPAVRMALLAVLLVISGHFAGFTYIRPLMENITKLSVGAISAILLGYGIGGFFGNFVGGYIAGRSERNAIVFGGTLIAVLAASLRLAGHRHHVVGLRLRRVSGRLPNLDRSRGSRSSRRCRWPAGRCVPDRDRHGRDRRRLAGRPRRRERRSALRRRRDDRGDAADAAIRSERRGGAGQCSDACRKSRRLMDAEQCP